MRFYILSDLKNKVIGFLTNNKKKEIVNQKTITIKNKKYNLFGFDKNFNQKTYCVIEQQAEEDEEIIKLLNFSLQIIPFIIRQEYEILKLQQYKKVNNNPFLYELLYLGLKEKFLDYDDTKPLIEVFYQTNRLNENQYLTLIKHYYLEDKEYG